MYTAEETSNRCFHRADLGERSPGDEVRTTILHQLPPWAGGRLKKGASRV